VEIRGSNPLGGTSLFAPVGGAASGVATGEHRREKAAKVATALTYWIPAVNKQGSLGRRSFLEVSDPWDATNLIRAHVASLAKAFA
jgi:hypothetical protein